MAGEASAANAQLAVVCNIASVWTPPGLGLVLLVLPVASAVYTFRNRIVYYIVFGAGFAFEMIRVLCCMLVGGYCELHRQICPHLHVDLSAAPPKCACPSFGCMLLLPQPAAV